MGEIKHINWLTTLPDSLTPQLTPNKTLEENTFDSLMTEYFPPANSNVDTNGKRAINTLRVLLAEDNLDNQTLIKLYIERTGAECIVANDGLEAIAEIIKGEVDLILMDMQMPHMDGMTATRYLRGKGINTPIYALTADESLQAVQEGKDAGCDGQLAKPLDATKLRQIIHNLESHLPRL